MQWNAATVRHLMHLFIRCIEAIFRAIHWMNRGYALCEICIANPPLAASMISLHSQEDADQADNETHTQQGESQPERNTNSHIAPSRRAFSDPTGRFLVSSDSNKPAPQPAKFNHDNNSPNPGDNA
jgi:hypothetical protein